MLGVPDRSDAATTWKRWILGPSLGNRILLYEEIASLAAAGIGIREALADLARRSSGRRGRAVTRVADAVAHGVPVGEALLGMPEHFAPVEARIVAAGERTGRLDRAFREAAGEASRAKRAITRFLSSLAYPVFLLHFALFVPGCVILTNARGRWGAQAVVWSAFLLTWAVALAVTTLHLSRRLQPGWGRACATIPIVGPVARSAAVSRACRVAASLHDSGEEVVATLEHAAEASGNGWVAQQIRAAADGVARGSPVATALAGVGAFGPEARSLLETGEQTGTLAESFRRIAEVEEARYGAAVTRLAVALGGLVFATVGLIVFLMFTSLLGKMYGGL